MLQHRMSQVAIIALFQKVSYIVVAITIIISPYYQIISAEIILMFSCRDFSFDDIQINSLFCFVNWHSLSLFILHDSNINLWHSLYFSIIGVWIISIDIPA